MSSFVIRRGCVPPGSGIDTPGWLKNYDCSGEPACALALRLCARHHGTRTHHKIQLVRTIDKELNRVVIPSYSTDYMNTLFYSLIFFPLINYLRDICNDLHLHVCKGITYAFFSSVSLSNSPMALRNAGDFFIRSP